MPRFEKRDVAEIIRELELPDVIRADNGCMMNSRDAFILLCVRLSFPHRWEELQVNFGKRRQVLIAVFSKLVDIILERLV